MTRQYKRDAVEAAVREIAEDREAFAEGRREALKRIGKILYSGSVERSPHCTPTRDLLSTRAHTG